MLLMLHKSPRKAMIDACEDTVAESKINLTLSFVELMKFSFGYRML